MGHLVKVKFGLKGTNPKKLQELPLAKVILKMSTIQTKIPFSVIINSLYDNCLLHGHFMSSPHYNYVQGLFVENCGIFKVTFSRGHSCNYFWVLSRLIGYPLIKIAIENLINFRN